MGADADFIALRVGQHHKSRLLLLRDQGPAGGKAGLDPLAGDLGGYPHVQVKPLRRLSVRFAVLKPQCRKVSVGIDQVVGEPRVPLQAEHRQARTA